MSIDRYHADGTPDPFTPAPEPMSIAPTAAGLGSLAIWKRKRAVK